MCVKVSDTVLLPITGLRTTTEPSFNKDSPDMCIFSLDGAPAEFSKLCTAIGSVPARMATFICIKKHHLRYTQLGTKLVPHNIKTSYLQTSYINWYSNHRERYTPQLMPLVKLAPPSTIRKANTMSWKKAWKNKCILIVNESWKINPGRKTNSITCPFIPNQMLVE